METAQLAHFLSDKLPRLLVEWQIEGVWTLFLCVALIAELALGRKRPNLPWLVMAAGWVTCGVLLWQMDIKWIYRAMMAQEGALVWLIWLLLGATGYLLWVHPHYRTGTQHRGESLAMWAGVGLGAWVAVHARQLILVFLAIELMSVCSYVLTSLDREQRPAAEAGMKYMLYGLFSAALLLYGLSLWPALGGSLVDPGQGFAPTTPEPQLWVMGLLILAGLTYKMGAWPFHFWMPDVFTGASLPVVALLATVPKVAAWALLFRLWPNLAMSSGSLWLLVGVGAIGLLWGNVMALRQTDFRRMMAYSGVANMGFLLLYYGVAKLASISHTALFPTLTLYFISYLLATLVAFWAAGALMQRTGTAEITGWRGKGRQEPLAAGLLLLSLVSLAGLPTTFGFIGKLLVFSTLATAEHVDGLLLLPLVWLALNTLPGFYYYLQPAAQLFRAGLDGQLPEERPTPQLQTDTAYRRSLLVAAVLAAPLLVLGLVGWDRLLEWLG
jgi:NADH-quinone oxidoreductase subunit N